MTRKESARLLFQLMGAYPSVPFPEPTVAEWDSWLLALPHEVGKRAVATVCASEDFPTVSALIRSCGISSEQVIAMLVAAKDGGFALVKDDTALYGWRTSQDALPAPQQSSERVKMPEDVRIKIKEHIGRIAAEKTVR